MRIVIIVDGPDVKVIEPSDAEVYVIELQYIADHEGGADHYRQLLPPDLHHIVNDYDPNFEVQ